MKPATHCEFYTCRDIRGQDVAHWVAGRIKGCERGWDKFVAMDVTRDGERIGGTIYHDWNPEAGTMCMSSAGGKGWLTRTVLFRMHSYIFDDVACQLAVLQVSEHNAVMLRIAEAYGYRKHLIPRLRGRNEAEYILTLTEEDWRASRFHRRS